MPKKYEVEKSIFWIRNDQRIYDNAALDACLSCSEFILPVFVIDDRLFKKNSLEIQVASNKRLMFLAQSLRQLIELYKRASGNVLIRFGNPAKEIIDLAEENNIKTIFASNEFTTHEISDEKAILKANFELKLFENATLIDPEDLNFKLEKLPETFSVFRKKVEAHWHVKQVIEAPSHIPLVPTINYDLSHQWIKDKLESTEEDAFFVGGEVEASKRLEEFVWSTKSIATYKETRNQLIGNHFSSKLSAWLSIGNISPRSIYWEIKRFESQVVKNESTYWLIFELLWRDFFKFNARKYGNRLFLSSGIQQKQRSRYTNAPRLETWLKANTGNPFIDANLIELSSTGYMSNRGRQNVASYLIHDLKIHWKLGAEFFEHHLIDFDPALNYGNWQYIAGIGNDPKPVRYFDTIWQAKNYDPQGDFIATWLPELSRYPCHERATPWLVDKRLNPPVFKD